MSRSGELATAFLYIDKALICRQGCWCALAANILVVRHNVALEAREVGLK